MSLAQRAMTSSALAPIYERAWRPLFRSWMGPTAPSQQRQRADAVLDLGLTHDSHSLLDVACGPGNFTKYLRRAMAADAVAVGLDASAPMIEQAVRSNVAPGVGYLRADARTLPFEDATFDAVCCYAALYLVPEPMRVLQEMIRVLAPGGRMALMTSIQRGPRPVGAVSAMVARHAGLTLFERETFTDALTAAGFEAVEQRIHGSAQFVSGRKGDAGSRPSPGTEF